MQISTNIKKEVDKIKELDSEARAQSEAAKDRMVEALKVAMMAGERLEAMKIEHGARNFKQILRLNFDDDFEVRAKRYQTVYKKHDNPRQCMLALGVMPEKESEPQEPRVKSDPGFVLIDKLQDHLRGKQEASGTFMIMLEELERDICAFKERMGG